MNYLLTTLILLATLLPSWAATSGVAGGIFLATDTTATNARPSAVTITPAVGGTNLFAGTLTATNSSTTGTGTDLNSQQLGVGRIGIFLSGTSAAPDTDVNPLLKASRTVNLQAAQYTGDGGPKGAAIYGIARGTPTNQIQVVGVYGAGVQASTNYSGANGNDTVGGYFLGTTEANATGKAIGAFVYSRNDYSTATGSALQILNWNGTGVVDSYDAVSAPSSMGIWMWSAGTNTTAGMLFANPSGPQFDYGIGFMGHIIAGVTGSVRVASIVDDGHAQDSILIRGQHTNSAIAIASNAGRVLIGATNTAVTSTLLEVLQENNVSGDPFIELGTKTLNNTRTILFRNLTGQHKLGVVGSANALLTGSAVGDFVIQAAVGGDILMGGSVPVLTIGEADTLSVFGGAAASNSNQFFNALSPNTTTGDITYYDGSANVRLAHGSAGSVLTMWPQTNNTFVPIWAMAPQVMEHLGTADFSSTVLLNSGTITNLTLLLPDTDEPSVISIASNAGTNAVASVRSGATALVFNSSTKRLHTRFQIPSVLSTDADGYEISDGFADQTTDAKVTDGAYFFYTHGENSGNIVGITSTNSTRTTATGGGSVAAVVNTWVDGYIEASATRARFWISTDGGATVTFIGESTSNIPTTTARATGIQHSLRKIGPGVTGTTSVLFYAGRMAFYPR